MAEELEKRGKQTISSTAPESIGGAGPAFSPDVDIYVNGDKLLFLVDLPGVRKGDVSIVLDEQENLVIKAPTAFKERQGTTLRQFRTGDFFRAFQISRDYDKDKIEANLDNGLLKIVVPRKEESKPRAIKINA